MLRRFLNIKLKYQLLLLTIVAVVLVILVQTAYYIKMTSITKDKIKSLTDQSVSQVEETVRIVFEKAKNAAMYFSYSSSIQSFMATGDTMARVNTKKYIEDMVKTAIEINSEIMDVVLLDTNGKKVYYYNEQITQVQEVIDEVQRGERGNGFIYIKTASKGEFLVYVTPVVYIIPDARHKERLGSILVFLNPEILRQIINKSAKPEDVLFYIVDNKEQIVVSNANKDKRGTAFGNNAGNMQEDKNTTVRKEIALTGWNIVGLVNEREIVKDYDFFKGFAMFVGLIMIFLLIAVSFAFNHNIAIPVAVLVKEIDKVGRSNWKYRINVKNRNEIGGIVSTINRMLDNLEAMSKRIFETQQKMYEVELSKKQTELYALQSQVNPHFLFNTLQCIGGIAMARDIPEVAQVIIAMGDIFKYSIKAEDLVKVGDEVKIAEQYLKIIDVRFGGKFRYELDIQEQILGHKMIKMVLQPIIENAVYHGLEKSYEDGYLRVKGWREKDSILFEILDNGPGIEEEILKRMQAMFSDMYELEKEGLKRQRIGLANIQWRIKLMLGEEYGLQIYNGKGRGTVVRITLPVS